ncbi:MAG: PAS domain S-box protein [Anaerolineales bacterium]|jgi:PAS domain S-box-containing protein
MSKKDRKAEGRSKESLDQNELFVLHRRIEELEGRLQEEIADRKRAEEDAQRRAVQTRLIYEISQRVSSELELDELFSAVVTAISDAFGYYSVILAPVDLGADCLTIGAIAGGFADIFPKDRKVPLGEGITGYAAATGETQISGDVSQDPHFLRLADEKTRSELAAPIKSGEQVIGVLDLQSEDFDAFDHNDVLLMETLADQVAVAMENARLYEQAQNEISERMRVEVELRQHQESLEERVGERTAELKASEERYRTLFDGIPVGLYRTTPAGQFLDANLALVQMYGYPNREKLLDTNLTEVYVDPEERVRWQSLMESQGVVRDFEAHIRRYDGTTFWANDTARAVKGQQGQVLYYEGSFEDITERKHAEEDLRQYQEHLEELVDERTAELQASEERYRTLFDGVPVGLYRTNPEGKVLDVNLACVQIFGYPNRETLLNTAITTEVYVDPKERARWQALMEEEGIVRDFEEQVRRFDGEIVWISDTARAVKDERGRVLYYEGRLEDITERKEFEEEIRRQKDYFEALFVNSPVAVMTADLDAKVVSWNPMAEKLFGYTQDEAVGKHIDDLVATNPSIREDAEAYTRELLTTDRVQATVRRNRKDGSLVDVEVLVLPTIVAGQKVGYIGIYYDISDLLQARREAESANQAKSIFLANMSHELRTPLNAILGFTQLMDGDPNLTAGQQENLEIINQSGEHLLALINDVLEMSKIEAGRVKLGENPFDLHYLLGSLEEVFRFQAENKGLDLRFQFTEDVPHYAISDEGKLRQVLNNLLGNAVKFTKEGSVELIVSASPDKSGKMELHFDIYDTGPGIAPEELESVFDPFVQAGDRTGSMSTQTPDGTGLGLSISRQFVHLMGGDISASSKLGQGSHFSFSIHVRVAGAEEVPTTEPKRDVLRLVPGQPVCRLLVVEDRETNRRLLVKLLERLGFEVQEATNGQEAIDVWQRWEPHLIWMDMRMPVMNGREATKRIKSMPGGQSVAIIALTATAFDEDREQILLDGCDDFVRKPFRKEEIFKMLIKHLDVQFIYEEPAPTPEAEESGAPIPSEDAETLAVQSPEWVAELRQAALTADLYRILDLIDQIRGQHPDLADTLSNLAERFEYQKILNLIVGAGGER